MLQVKYPLSFNFKTVLPAVEKPRLETKLRNIRLLRWPSSFPIIQIFPRLFTTTIVFYAYVRSGFSRHSASFVRKTDERTDSRDFTNFCVCLLLLLGSDNNALHHITNTLLAHIMRIFEEQWNCQFFSTLLDF